MRQVDDVLAGRHNPAASVVSDLVIIWQLRLPDFLLEDPLCALVELSYSTNGYGTFATTDI